MQPVPAGSARARQRHRDHRGPRVTSGTSRALHGLTRSLVANMVTGVKDGFERKLEIVGIGYRAQMQGKAIQLALGYSHPVIFRSPRASRRRSTSRSAITLRGADKALLGQTAAKLRALRKPDPYKGKGIKYAGRGDPPEGRQEGGGEVITKDRRAPADIRHSGCAAGCAARPSGRGWRCSAASTTSTRSSSTTRRARRCSRSTAGAPEFRAPQDGRQRRRRQAVGELLAEKAKARRHPARWCSIGAATSITDA